MNALMQSRLRVVGDLAREWIHFGRSDTAHAQRDLSAYDPPSSAHSSTIVSRGLGNENGAASKSSGRQSPSSTSLLSPRPGNDVMRMYRIGERATLVNTPRMFA